MNAARNRIGKDPSRRLPPPVVVQRPSSLNGVVAVVANPNPNHGTTLAAAAAVDADDDSYLVSCRCESAKAVSTLLSCLHRIATGSDVAEREVWHGNTANNSSGGWRQHNGTATTTTTRTTTRRRASSGIQPVTVYCAASGLTFHAYGKSKQMQASVDMPALLFSDYSISVNDGSSCTRTMDNGDASNTVGGEFCVNLTTVVECLYSLGTHNLDKTKLCFSYNVTQELFKLELLEESGVLSTAAIPGLVPPSDDDDDMDNSLALIFRSHPEVARIIVHSETLHDLVAELPLVAGGTTATVSLTAQQGLQMAVVGHLGECHIDWPVRGRHVVSVEFPSSTTEPRSLLRYPLHALTESMRGLEIAQETCLTINAAGMLAIQHQVLDPTLSDQAPSFIDFILCCLQYEDDEASRAVPQNHAARTSSHRSISSSVWSHGEQSEPVPATQSTMTTERSSAAHIVSQNKVRYDSDRDDDDDHTDSEAAATTVDLLTDIGAPETASTAAAATSSFQHMFGSIVAVAKDGDSKRPTTLRGVSRRRHIPERADDEKKNETDTEEEEEAYVDDIATLIARPRQRRRRTTTFRRRIPRRPAGGTNLASPDKYDDDEDDPPSSPELVYGSQE
jgi:hypothetical protein